MAVVDKVMYPILFFLFLIKQSESINSGRIIGGSDANMGSFAFAVAVNYHTEDGTYFCGGTLLNARFILTSGHCVVNAQEFTLYLGSAERLGGETASTYDYTLHPQFSSVPLMNDLGLIEMRMNIIFTAFLRPVQKLPSEEIKVGAGVQALGWGTTSDSDSSFSDTLKVVSMSVISNEECQMIYGGQITDEKICAVGSYNEGICSGDSGGPVVQFDGRGHYTLFAVSSFISQNGCETTEPSGFTRVYPFVDWIRNVSVVTV